MKKTLAHLTILALLAVLVMPMTACAKYDEAKDEATEAAETAGEMMDDAKEGAEETMDDAGEAGEEMMDDAEEKMNGDDSAAKK